MPTAMQSASAHAAHRASLMRGAADGFSKEFSALSRHARELASARDSLKSFVYIIGRDQHGHSLRRDPLTDLICDSIQFCHERRVNLSKIAPFAIGKSTLARLACAWLVGKRRDANQVWISAEMAASEKNSSVVRDIIDLPRYRTIFPEVAPDRRRDTIGETKVSGRGWARSRWYIQGKGQAADPTCEAVACMPLGEARRTNILFADDLMTNKTMETPSIEESICGAFFNTWVEGRCAQDGWILAMQNCWNKTDLAHRLLDDAKFCSLWIGVSADCERLFVRIWNAPEGFPLIESPKAYSAEPVEPHAGAEFEVFMPLPDAPNYKPENLRKVRSDIFTRAFRLVASSQADFMFPAWPSRASAGRTAADQIRCDEVNGRVFVPQSRRGALLFGAGMDISSEKRPGDVIWIAALDNQRRIMPVEVHKGNFSASEVVAVLNDAWNRGLCFLRFLVENNATQDKFVTEVRKAGAQGAEWIGRVQPFQTGKNKADEVMGLPALNAEIESGAILWPSGESSREDAAHAFAWRATESGFAECRRFPKRGETPDEVMAFWFARRALEGFAAPGVGYIKTSGVGTSRSKDRAFAY